MEFITNKIEAVKTELNKLKNTPNYDLLKSIIEILEEVAGKQDLQTVKIDELEEKTEYQDSMINDIQKVIIDALDLTEIEEKDEKECDCDDCHHEEHQKDRVDDFYTLQCPFCEELFFIENYEINNTVECPFCNKSIKASENIVKH